MIDIMKKIEGRGAYMCESEKCFEIAKKKKALSRALKINIDNNKYNELRGVMFDRNR